MLVRRMAARPLFLGLSAAQNLCWAVAFTLGLVYQVKVAQLSALELVLVGTFLEVTCFVCEIPTGVVADLHSRRLSIVIGFALIGVGMLTIGTWPAFGPILAGTVLWGLGFTFISGSIEAWITDEIGATQVQRSFTLAEQWGLVGTVAGTVVAGLLALIDLRVPQLAAGAGFILLAVVVALVMPEDGFSPVPAEDRESFAAMKQTLTSGLRAARTTPVVRTFLVVGLLTGLGSEVFDRLWVDRVLKDFHLPEVFGADPAVVWFTGFALVSAGLSLVASKLANRFAAASLNSAHPTRPMATLMGLQVVGIAGFALAPWLGLALVCVWLRDAAIVVANPVRRAWLNRNIEPEARATTLSMMGQADAIGQVVGGPALGALAQRTSVVAALLASAIVQLPAIGLLATVRPNRGSATTATADQAG